MNKNSSRLFPIFFAVLSALGLSASVARAETNAYPSVYIQATDSSASEPGDNTGAFKVSRSSFGAYTNDLTVYYNITGSASNGVDYVAITNFVTIPAGASNATIAIQPMDDLLLEGTEAVTLTLRQITGGTSSNTITYQIMSPSSATVYIADNEINQPPTVSLVNPTNGASFQAPVNVLLQAAASDSDGSVVRVDFLKGTNLIGYTLHSDTNTGLYNFIWTNPSPGNFTLFARANDNLEGRGTSAPVNITIIGQTNTEVPVVTVTATDSSASEPGSNTGTFRLSRSGNTNAALSVYCVFSGSASNGVDYTSLPNFVSIPAGATAAEIVVHPIDDSIVEGTENVILSLVPSPTLPPVNYIIGSPSNAYVNIADNDTTASNAPPKVHIFAPTNGAVFFAPASIGIHADASDVDDFIDTVEFFAGTNSLGKITNCPPCDYIDPFHVTWTNVPAGNYVLTAKATDTRGASSVSDPVNIYVQTAPTIPTVKIVATDQWASEGNSSANPGSNTGLFTISRNGFTNDDLSVAYLIGGSASNGVDYAAIADSVTIPAGLLSTTILISPIDDTLIENTEYVVLTLVSNSNYLLGNDGRMANVYIEDNDRITNPPPPSIFVHITSPTNGSVFVGPTNILITAEATSSNSTIVRVDFFYGDHLIGTSSNAPYSVNWSNALPGYYTLTAKATDDHGAMASSPPVTISIKSAFETSFVKRQLPLWYVPGVKLIVRLYASPRTNTLNWSAADLPPANWIVGAVSEGGAFDSNDGKVKFGPFSNSLPRSLTYEVTPPANETGEKHFAGTATADGATSPIAGPGGIINAPPHPADFSPVNFSMALDEVLAYSNAWKYCVKWTNAPNPIPVSYLTRAGYLLGSGGAYTLSTVYPTPFPPLLWVPLTGDPGTCTPTTSIGTREPYVTNSCGSAISSLPTNYFSGVPFTVTITVNPPSNTLAYAVEDRPPLGFVVANISDGGVFCPETRKVKWGIFLDNAPRALTYQVTPYTNLIGTAYFSGVASFDGHNIPITGQRVTKYGGGTTPAVLQSVKTLDNGDRLMIFTGAPGACYVIEASTDLQTWIPIEQLLNNDGVLNFTDPAGGNFDNRFYRAVPMQ